MSDTASLDTQEFPIPPKRPSALPPLPGTVAVEFGARSHVGKVRDKNEDHFLISQIGRTLRVLQTSLPPGEVPGEIEEAAYGMVVADGMGGMAGGARASLLAIRTGVKLVLESPRWALRIDETEAKLLIDRMKEYFLKVDETLIEETKTNPRLTGMGTTLTVAYSAGSHGFIVHAGDSRAYLFRNGELRQLTRDHTLAQNLADVGAIPQGDVRTLPTRHILTNFAGGPIRGISPEIITFELVDGDRLLLCTDGLTGMLRDAKIAEILMQYDRPDDAAQALIDHALDKGGKDNVTVILAQYRMVPPQASTELDVNVF